MYEEEQILDYYPEEPERSFYEPILWWEKRRVWYNVLLIGLITAIMVYYLEGTRRYGYSDAIIDSFVVCTIANIFYSIGWVFEMIISYFYSTFRIPTKGRSFLYISGILFSLALAWFFYTSELVYLEGMGWYRY